MDRRTFFKATLLSACAAIIPASVAEESKVYSPIMFGFGFEDDGIVDLGMVTRMCEKSLRKSLSSYSVAAWVKKPEWSVGKKLNGHDNHLLVCRVLVEVGADNQPMRVLA